LHCHVSQRCKIDCLSTYENFLDNCELGILLIVANMEPMPGVLRESIEHNYLSRQTVTDVRANETSHP